MKKWTRIKDAITEWLAIGAAIVTIAGAAITIAAYVVLYVGFPFAVIFVAWHFIRKHW